MECSGLRKWYSRNKRGKKEKKKKKRVWVRVWRRKKERKKEKEKKGRRAHVCGEKKKRNYITIFSQ